MNKYLIIFFLFIVPSLSFGQEIIDKYGALIRSDTSKQVIYLCFTGHDYSEGFEHVLSVLELHEIRASFFLTGDFIRNNSMLVKRIKEKDHFIGAHSDKHLLYCDWKKIDSLLLSENVIKQDIQENLLELNQINIFPEYFMPPYEWYNSKVVEIAESIGQKVVNFSPGTRSNADYTFPQMVNYVSSEAILQSIYDYEGTYGMNGFHLLIHPGTSPQRKDKLYQYLDEIIQYLKDHKYRFNSFQE